MPADNAAAASPPPTADPQDPLPESNWFWRRVFVFAFSAALLLLVWLKVDTVGDVARGGSVEAVKGLVQLLRICLQLLGVLMLFYMIAPSAEQISKMLATVSAWKGGVSTTSTSRATSPDGSSAEATTTAGAPAGGGMPTPPVPPVAPAPPAVPAAAATAGTAIIE